MQEIKVTGRPYVGPVVTVRLPDDVLASVETERQLCGMSRAQWLRAAVEATLEQVAQRER
jgi:Ribbon-helix-helix protein, copG family